MESQVSLEFLALLSGGGAPVEKIIEQIILHEQIFNFQIFLKNKQIADLNKTQGNNIHYNTLELFHTRNFSNYTKNPNKYLQLNDQQLFKLKLLTIVELAIEKKTLRFKEMIQALAPLGTKDNYELQTIIHEAINVGLIIGKIDEEAGLIKVLQVKEVNSNKFNKEFMLSKVDKWLKNIEKSDEFIEKQIEGLREQTKDFNSNIINHVKRIEEEQMKKLNILTKNNK